MISQSAIENASTQMATVTHRGTNESISSKLKQGFLKANYPRPNNAFTRWFDHPKSAVWVSEGQPTWWNRIWSGMIGKNGQASITFNVNKSLIKQPAGWGKRWFGKSQRVIEQDVPIPEDAIVRYKD